MTNQLENKTLDEELKIRLDRLQENKKVSPWDWAEKIEKMDDPVQEFIGSNLVYDLLLEEAMLKGYKFVFENQLENGRLKKFRYIYGDRVIHHVEKKTLKNGQEAMYTKIKSTADDIELEATQTKDGDFVGPFHFKNKEIEVNAFYDENTYGLYQQSLLHGKVVLNEKGDCRLERSIRASYHKGTPQKFKEILCVPQEDLEYINSEKYKYGELVYRFKKGMGDEVRECFYENGHIVKTKSMDMDAYKAKKTAKLLGLLALGTVLCMAGAHLVKTQIIPQPIQKQYQRD